MDRSFKWNPKPQGLLYFEKQHGKLWIVLFTLGHNKVWTVVPGDLHSICQQMPWRKTTGLKNWAWIRVWPVSDWKGWLFVLYSHKAWLHCHHCYWHGKYTAVQSGLVRHSSLIQGRTFKNFVDCKYMRRWRGWGKGRRTVQVEETLGSILPVPLPRERRTYPKSLFAVVPPLLKYLQYGDSADFLFHTQILTWRGEPGRGMWFYNLCDISVRSPPDLWYAHSGAVERGHSVGWVTAREAQNPSPGQGGCQYPPHSMGSGPAISRLHPLSELKHSLGHRSVKSSNWLTWKKKQLFHPGAKALYQQESVSAMFQINAGRGACQRGRALRSYAAPSSVLLMAPSLACLKKVVFTMHHGDGWAWLMGLGTKEKRSSSPPCWRPRRDEMQPCFHPWVGKAVCEFAEGWLIAHNSCHRWGKWRATLVQSTQPTGMLRTPQASGTSLFL